MAGRSIGPVRRDALARVAAETWPSEGGPSRAHASGAGADERADAGAGATAAGGTPPRSTDPRRWVRAVRRRAAPVLAFTAAVTALAALWAYQTPPVYRSTATLLIDGAGAGAVAGGVDDAGGASGPGTGVGSGRTELELLRSRSLAERALRSLDEGGASVTATSGAPMAEALREGLGVAMREGRELGGRLAGGWPYLEPVGDSVGDGASDTDAVAANAPADGAADAAVASPSGRADIDVDVLMARLDIRPVAGTDLVRVTHEATDPVSAARGADAVVDAYLEASREARESAVVETSRWVAERGEALRGAVAEAERRVREFRTERPGVGAVDEADRRDEQRLFLLDRDLGRAREALATLDAELAGASGDGAEVARERRELALRRIEALEAQTTAVVERAAERDEGRAALRALERELDTERARHDGFVDSVREAGAERGPTPVDARLVDAATLPERPLGPSPWAIVALAALAALLLSTLWAVLAEALDRSVKGADDIERDLGLTLLGVLPAVDRGRRPSRRAALPLNPVRTAARDGAFRDALDGARAVVRLAEGRRRRHVLLVSSALPGEGRSSAALGLAHAFSGAERVLLIDCDVQRPSIGAVAGLEPDAPGLSDVLVGAIRAGRAIRHDVLDGVFDVLPAGPPPERPTELLSAPRLARMLDLLTDHYDRIVLDCGPVRTDSDALAFARLADAAVFVIDSRATPIDAARRAVGRVRRAGLPIVGALVTRVEAGELAAYGEHARDHERRRGGEEARREGPRLALTASERRELYREDDLFELGMGGADLTADLDDDATQVLEAGPGGPRTLASPPTARVGGPSGNIDRAPDGAYGAGAGAHAVPAHEPPLDETGEFDSTLDLSDEIARGDVPDRERPAYDPFAYDPDVDDGGYDDRDVNALVARVMAESAGRPPPRATAPSGAPPRHAAAESAAAPQRRRRVAGAGGSRTDDRDAS